MKTLLFAALMLTTTLSAAVSSEDYGWAFESSLPGVVYYWHTVNGPDADLVGRLEVTTEAYLSGFVTYHFPASEHVDDDPPFVDSTAPVLSIAFGFADEPQAQTGNRYREQPTGTEDGADSDFFLSFGPLLQGAIGTGGNGTILNMGSQGPALWVISKFIDFNTDTTAFLCPPFPEDSCAGITGFWLLDRSTVPVPIPSTLLLTGIGLLVLRRFISPSHLA